MSYDKCPNCGKSLKGFLSADLLPESKIEFINKSLKKSEDGYCTSCATELLDTIVQNSSERQRELKARLKQVIHHIPIISSPAPEKWDYDVIEMVTTQTTTGTGFLTELSRSFNDFFGTTSNTTNQKIASATNLCKTDLRIQCVKLGGNAVVSTDIDFNEVGAGTTNMLMVCMAGTAITIKNMPSLGAERRSGIIEVTEILEELEAISEMQGFQ